MNIDLLNTLVKIEQTADANQPSLFPFPLGLHMAFVSIATIFFIYRFYSSKRPYQAILAVAIFISLGFWISENKALYYAIGAIQLVLLIAALVSSFVWKAPAENSGKPEKSADKSGEEKS